MFTDLSELDLRELNINVSINGESEYISEDTDYLNGTGITEGHEAIVYSLIIEINGTEYVINKINDNLREALEEAAEKELNKQL
jgi:hypothetical protein